MKATNLLVASTGEIFSQFILGLASIAIKPLSENTLIRRRTTSATFRSNILLSE